MMQKFKATPDVLSIKERWMFSVLGSAIMDWWHWKRINWDSCGHTTVYSVHELPLLEGDTLAN